MYAFVSSSSGGVNEAYITNYLIVITGIFMKHTSASILIRCKAKYIAQVASLNTTIKQKLHTGSTDITKLSYKFNNLLAEKNYLTPLQYGLFNENLPTVLLHCFNLNIPHEYVCVCVCHYDVQHSHTLCSLRNTTKHFQIYPNPPWYHQLCKGVPDPYFSNGK